MRTASWKVGAVAAALVLGLAACGDDDDDGASEGGTGDAPAGVTVTAADTAFDPTELRAGAGDTITLVNEDSVEHSFTIDDPEVDIEAEGGEEGEGSAPDEAGTYDFYCRYHPAVMQGTLTVE
jgi:plastocyanin